MWPDCDITNNRKCHGDSSDQNLIHLISHIIILRQPSFCDFSVKSRWTHRLYYEVKMTNFSHLQLVTNWNISTSQLQLIFARHVTAMWKVRFAFGSLCFHISVDFGSRWNYGNCVWSSKLVWFCLFFITCKYKNIYSLNIVFIKEVPVSVVFAIKLILCIWYVYILLITVGI